MNDAVLHFLTPMYYWSNNFGQETPNNVSHLTRCRCLLMALIFRGLDIKRHLCIQFFLNWSSHNECIDIRKKNPYHINIIHTNILFLQNN